MWYRRYECHAETLKLVEGFDLKGMGHNSPAYIETLAEAMRIATNDRSSIVGDPDHYQSDVLAVLDPGALADRVERIKSGHKEQVIHITANGSAMYDWTM
ncbi:Gamma-glutamyltranspeptidase [compost metagenome]